MPQAAQTISINRSSSEWHDRFFTHVRSVFPGADFEPWTKAGCWTSRYDVLCHVIGGEIVATVGRTRMMLSLGSEEPQAGFRRLVPGLQLGAVGVKAEYRGEGFGKKLATQVLQEADHQGLPVFLFANQAARGFYTHLGFSPQESRRAIVDIRVNPGSEKARILDPSDEADRAIIRAAAASSPSHRGALAARTDPSILIWYLFNTPVRALLPDDSMIAFVEDEPDGTFVIRDWLGERPSDLAAILPRLVSRPVSRLAFGFIPPDSWRLPGTSLATDRESHMFLRGLVLPPQPLCFPEMLRT